MTVQAEHLLWGNEFKKTEVIMINKQKILIVDDDNNIAELISLYLTKECFETMIVNDGESVLAAIDSFEPNLMLLDHKKTENHGK